LWRFASEKIGANEEKAVEKGGMEDWKSGGVFYSYSDYEGNDNAGCLNLGFTRMTRRIRFLRTGKPKHLRVGDMEKYEERDRAILKMK